MSDELATQAIEAERSQIGHEIHDSLLPLVVAAKMALEGYADDQPEDKRLTQAITWLTDALTTGRQLLSQTYPPELDAVSWVQAAKDFAQQQSDTEIQWDVSGDSHDYAIPIATAAYRIVVESIRNATRHGQATEVSVSATNSEVVVTDNGRGFDPASVSNDRFGIRCMKGRANLVGGQLEVVSTAGGPTSVKFTLPVQ